MMSWVNGWKYENPLQSINNTSWLTCLRMWYYFRLCFSFSCSGYDLTLIKKSHTLNCYSFPQTFLLKTKLTNSLLVTVIAQFTAKTTDSLNAIYFLSLMSCSKNKLRCHMLFSRKKKKSQFFVEKKLYPTSTPPPLFLQSCSMWYNFI